MDIRNITREKRRQLSSSERHTAEQTIYQTIKKHPHVNKAQHIAIFLPFDGEVNTKPIIDDLWHQNKLVYLPVLHPFTPNHLLFIKYTPQTILLKKYFGLLEPQLNVNDILPYQQLDIIFTPLVAFDARGYRLGMGGGYYDRLLSEYQKYHIMPIGLAFSCQKVPLIKNQPWDIKLPEIIYA